MHDDKIDTADLLTFGFPENIDVGFGRVSFGAESPRQAYEVSGLDFRICCTVPRADHTLVVGLKSPNGLPQVWRALTQDGIAFTEAAMLFEAPDSVSPWIAGDVALKDDTLVLLQSQMGTPPTKGHPFHAFSAPLAGDGEWRKLNSELIYRGQDSFALVWNSELKLFVNYQISYQTWPKRFADNMPSVRRVLHIRTSPDGMQWTPGASFGVDGPHLPDEQLIVPDDLDTPDTEFYHFSPVDFGEFWAGIMVKYVSQPGVLPTCGGYPHGPFLDYEWWIGRDGLHWERPFRERSGLDQAEHPFAYFLTQPIVVGDECRWPIRGRVCVLDRRRMFYAYSRANAELTTRLLTLSGQPICLDISFDAVRRGGDPALRQGYLMAELLDPDGAVVQGFDRDKCVFEPDESTRLTLKWGDRHLPGSRVGPVRLRILFRDVRLYSAAC